MRLTGGEGCEEDLAALLLLQPAKLELLIQCLYPGKGMQGISTGKIRNSPIVYHARYGYIEVWNDGT